MKFFIDNWMLFLVAFSSGAMLLWPLVRNAAVAGLSAPAAVQLVNREKGVLIDVCEPEEFAQAHAIGAKNIPLNSLDAQLPAVVKNKSTPIILVCQTGARAQRALVSAKKLGYERAQVLGGGMRAWREATLPVEGSIDAAAAAAKSPANPAA